MLIMDVEGTDGRERGEEQVNMIYNYNYYIYNNFIPYIYYIRRFIFFP